MILRLSKSTQIQNCFQNQSLYRNHTIFTQLSRDVVQYMVYIPLVKYPLLSFPKLETISMKVFQSDPLPASSEKTPPL